MLAKCLHEYSVYTPGIPQAMYRKRGHLTWGLNLRR